MLKGTYTGTVYANSSVSLGFNGVKSGDPVITDYSLTEVVLNEKLFDSAELNNALVDGSFANDKVYAEAMYDSENENIDISWNATASGKFFEIYISDDNKDYKLYEVVDAKIFNSTYHNNYSCIQIYIPDKDMAISPALREKIAYITCDPYTAVSDSHIRYEWAEEKYFIPVDSVIKTNEFYKYAAGNECAVIIEAAEGFKNVETLEIPSTIDGVNIVKISNYAFQNQSSLKSIVLPNEIIDIGISAFENCNNLVEVNFPEKLQYIRKGAFKNCALKKINIFSNVKIIGDSAFEYCNFLESIIVDNNNKSYYSKDEVLFKYDNDEPSLIKYPSAHDRKEYTIPDNIKVIEKSAFWNCSNLTNITIPAAVEKMGESVFFGCNSLEFIDVNKNNNKFSSVDGVLFNKNKTRLIQYPVGNNREEYTIPYGVKVIRKQAFLICIKLKSVTIPGSVELIEDSAFLECIELENVVISEGVEVICDSAFRDCEKLDNVLIPESVKKIEDYAFYSCGSLSNVTFKKETPENYADNIFWGSDGNLKIYVPRESIEHYKQWITASGVSFYPITEE